MCVCDSFSSILFFSVLTNFDYLLGSKWLFFISITDDNNNNGIFFFILSLSFCCFHHCVSNTKSCHGISETVHKINQDKIWSVWKFILYFPPHINYSCKKNFLKSHLYYFGGCSSKQSFILFIFFFCKLKNKQSFHK